MSVLNNSRGKLKDLKKLHITSFCEFILKYKPYVVVYNISRVFYSATGKILSHFTTVVKPASNVLKIKTFLRDECYKCVRRNLKRAKSDYSLQ